MGAPRGLSSAEREQRGDALAVERGAALPAQAGGRAHAGDVGAGGADGGEVLGAQRAGQRDLEAGRVPVGDERGDLLRVQPLEQPAPVLDRRVEQAAGDAARRAAATRSPGGSGRLATRAASA